jgi:hypothetical protein
MSKLTELIELWRSEDPPGCPDHSLCLRCADAVQSALDAGAAKIRSMDDAYAEPADYLAGMDAFWS